MLAEWDDLAAEERLEKRRKAGKISAKEYNEAMKVLNERAGVEEDEALAAVDVKKKKKASKGGAK